MKSPAFLLNAGFLFFVCVFSPARTQAQSHYAEPAPTPARSETLERNDSERQFFELLNHERAANGLPALQWDDALFRAARQHALAMLNQNRMEHELPGEPGFEERVTAAGARFSYIAENIAVGGNPQTIHNGWMGSAGHRKNILEPRVTSVGIAAVRGNGGLFAVEDFAEAFSNLTREQQEKQVTSLLTTMGLRVTANTNDARKACESQGGIAGVRSWSVMHFETTDLSKLPPEVEKKVRSEGHTNVAVGACHTSTAAGFARYKIALLFY